VQIIRQFSQGVALIDPAKKVGEAGQYRRLPPDYEGLGAVVIAAKVAGLEIRHYYKNLATEAGEIVSSQLIITELPPGHVQPFHTHLKLHEMTIVHDGIIVNIESETLQETDVAEIIERGARLGPGDLVIEEPGKRHTQMNPGTVYAVTYTVQTARIPLEQFPSDWNR
jgi:hypothetical protein